MVLSTGEGSKLRDKDTKEGRPYRLLRYLDQMQVENGGEYAVRYTYTKELVAISKELGWGGGGPKAIRRNLCALSRGGLIAERADEKAKTITVLKKG